MMAAILSCVALGACDPVDEAPLDLAATLRDPNVPLWTLSGSPELRVSGGVAGGDSIFLYDIRGATFTDRGDIAVAVGGGANRVIYTVLIRRRLRPIIGCEAPAAPLVARPPFRTPSTRQCASMPMT